MDKKINAQMPKSPTEEGFSDVNVTSTNRRCKLKKLSLPLIVSIFAFFVSIAYAQTGTVNVEISDINDPKGLMSIGLYSKKGGS